MRVAADLWAAADTIITSGAIAVGVGAALLAVFADRLPPAKLKEQQDGSFRWGIMGAVSCLPLFNWLAWVFAALEDEERARLYYWFAALYALPLLRNGFDFDGFSVAMLLVGVAHVQAERIANTEPESQAAVARALSPLSVLKTAARAARAAAGALFGGAPSSRGAGRLPAGGAGARGWGERVQGEQEGEVEFEKKFEKTRSQELEEKYRADELADFDRRLRERDAEARRGGRR